MMWQTYKEKIKVLSEALVEIQRPIRILNAIKIDGTVEASFRESSYRLIPKPQDWPPLGFSTEIKMRELRELRTKIAIDLDKKDPIRELLDKMIDEYLLVCELLESRGTKRFYEISRQLYGSPQDSFRSDHNTILSMSQLLYSILTGIKNSLAIPNTEKTLTAEQAVSSLNQRFLTRFQNEEVMAILSDGIVADAAAGGDRIKLRAKALFSERDLDILEVHEGWVHVGTTLNGRRQPVAQWLSVGPPRCTSTQEGLAVLMEIFTFRSSVRRAQMINDRIMGIAKIEEGANLIEVFEYFRTEGYEEEECLSQSLRLFRGSSLEGGGPFTKDLSYCKGFVENYNFMRTAIRANKPELIPFLFVGKVHVEDIPLLYHLHREGIVTFPEHLPPHFQDINGIAVWMSFSSFFNKVNLKKVQAHYNRLFHQFT